MALLDDRTPGYLDYPFNKQGKIKGAHMQEPTSAQRARINNPQMLDLILRYLNERSSLGDLSGKSEDVMRMRLTSFAAHCESHPLEVSRNDVRQWLASMNLRPASFRAYLSTLAGFYKWMNEEELIAHDPTLGVRRPKIRKGENRSLTDAELARLYKVLPDVRAELIVSLMVGEGLRCDEVARVQVHDADLIEDVVHVRGKGRRGQRSRTVPFTPKTRALLATYLGETSIASGPLIRSQSRGRGEEGVSANAISSMVSFWMTDAKLKRGPYDGVSAHALRHTAAEQVAELTDDIRQVQVFLGHENFATTQIYLRRDVRGLAELQAKRS